MLRGGRGGADRAVQRRGAPTPQSASGQSREPQTLRKRGGERDRAPALLLAGRDDAVCDARDFLVVLVGVVRECALGLWEGGEGVRWKALTMTQAVVLATMLTNIREPFPVARAWRYGREGTRL